MRRVAVFARVLLLLALATGASCPVTPPPHGYAVGALDLRPAARHPDALNCPRQDCERWYRMSVAEKGTFYVYVDALPVNQAAPRYSVRLTDSSGTDVIAQQSSAGSPGVRLDREVGPDTYLVAVVSEKPGSQFQFQVTLDFEAAPPPPPPPPPPEPEFEVQTSSVLEAEGYGQDVVAVLIEAGSKRGMRVGFQGRLVDNGVTIGTLVIEQVYPDGSRARVEGALSGPVTHETVAEIDVPRGLLPESGEDPGQP